MLKKWLKAIEVYGDKRMLTMVLLGFSSGFPYLLVFGTFSLWLKDAGVSLAAIGLFSLAKAPYSFKWLWSPVVDRLYLPLFGRLGRRRGCALFAQIWLMLAIWGMAITNPAQNPVNMAIFAFLMVMAPERRFPPPDVPAALQSSLPARASDCTCRFRWQ